MGNVVAIEDYLWRSMVEAADRCIASGMTREQVCAVMRLAIAVEDDDISDEEFLARVQKELYGNAQDQSPEA
jgi:hypothetical protein